MAAEKLRSFRKSPALFAIILIGCAVSSGWAQSSPAPLQLPGLSSDSSAGSALSGFDLSTSNGPPSVKVADPVYNFGAVFQGAQVKHTFRVENGGPGPLTLGAVQTSCGCTVAQPTKKQLMPGESSEIAAAFDTSADKGPAQRIITVNTNDPKTKQIKLTMKGDVRVKVDANPTPVVFNDVKHGTEISRQVSITEMIGSSDFKITSINHSDPNLKITQAPRTDGKAGAILTITLLKSAPAESFSDVVKVATSLAPVNIPVSGNVTGDLSVVPAQVSFGIVKHHAGMLRFARLTNVGERPVKLLSATSNRPGVTAAIAPVTPGKDFKLTLQLQPNQPDGTLSGIISIKTDDPAQPVVQLPFFAAIGLS